MSSHPLLGCAAIVTDALKDVADVSVTFMETTDKRDALLALAEAAAGIEELRLRILADAGDVARDHGYRDVGQWLAHATLEDGSSMRRSLRLARALDRRWIRVAEALAEGRVNAAQAEAIVNGLEELPEGTPLEVRLDAERHLIEQARTFPPRLLRVLARRVLDVVAPAIADDHERRLLEAEEREARKRTSLVTHRNGDGTTTIRIRVPDAVASRLDTYLAAYASPRRDHLDEHAGPDAPGCAEASAVPYDVKLGHAFCALLELLDPRRLPVHGGDATTVVVTLDLPALLDGLGTAALADGTPITAGEARRLACNAGIVPAVLGGASELLDLGRTRRLFTAPQRRAMRIRDRRCRGHGCDIPADWTEAHHLTPWQAGGRTDVSDGVLLCAFHHHLIHDPAYHHVRLADGDIRFHRRR